MLTFSGYQAQAHGTAQYPADRAIEYLVCGLASEAGEVAGKWKKVIRDEGGIIPDDGPHSIEAMLAEVGDVFWYCAELCTMLGATLEDVAQYNLDKLRKRSDEDVIKGDGDNRTGKE